MTHYTKRPDNVEARQFSGLASLGECEELAAWCGGVFSYDHGAGQEGKTYYWQINSLQHNFFATAGWYIIRSADESFRSMNAKDFEREYQEVSA